MTVGSVLACVTVAAVAAALVAPVPAAAAERPRGVVVRPAKLTLSADPTALHSVGSTIVDGYRTVRTGLDAPLRLVGRATRGWVVVTAGPDGLDRTLWRVRPDGSALRLRSLGDEGDDVRTSSAGRRVALTVSGRRSTLALVLRTSDGTVVGQRRFRGLLEVLALPGRVLLSGVQPRRTVWWWPRTGATERVLRRESWAADAERDRLVQVVRDPAGYDGICLAQGRLSTPAVRDWRSCTDKPLAWSPSGRRMVTTNIESDGIGPNLLQVRDAATNRVRATYRTFGYFGLPYWEDGNSFLVLTWARERAAIVRVTTGGRVSRVSPVVRMRDVEDALGWGFPPA